MFWPVAARAQDSADARLDRVVDIQRPISAKLDDFCDFLSKRLGVTVIADHAAFKREKAIYDGAKKIKLPKLPGVRGRTALEWALDQADLRYEVRANKVMIVPMIRDGQEFEFPPTRIKMAERELALKNAGSKTVDFEQPINASLRDVVEFLSDRFDLTIVIYEPAFARLQNNKKVQETQINLPAKSVALRDALEDIAKKVGGIVEYRDDHIRITAKPDK
jgi:hypothetical protein